MSEPQRDHGGVDAGVQERHRGGVAQDVRRDRLGAQRRAALGGVGGVLGDPAGERFAGVALAICPVLLDSERERYEPGAVRWAGRFLLERRCRSLQDAEAIAANLAALGHPRKARLAALELSELCREAGLTRAAVLLETRSQQRQSGA